MIRPKRLFPLMWVVFGIGYSAVVPMDEMFRLEVVGFYVGMFVPMWFALNIEWERVTPRRRDLGHTIILMMLSLFCFLPSVILEVFNAGGVVDLVSELLLAAGWSLIALGALVIGVLAAEGELHLVPDNDMGVVTPT